MTRIDEIAIIECLASSASILLRRLGANHQEIGWPNGIYSDGARERMQLVADGDPSVAYLSRIGAHLKDASWITHIERVAVVAAWLLWGDPEQWPAPEECREVASLLLDFSGRRDVNALWLRGHLMEAKKVS